MSRYHSLIHRISSLYRPSRSTGAIVAHGAEDSQGRALHVIAALRHCAKRLKEADRTVRFVSVDSQVVEAALESLSFQTRLQIDINDATPINNPKRCFSDAAVYIGVVFDDTATLGLEQAQLYNVTCIAAAQFPRSDQFSPRLMQHLRAAHDPSVLARYLCAAIALPND